MRKSATKIVYTIPINFGLRLHYLKTKRILIALRCLIIMNMITYHVTLSSS